MLNSSPLNTALLNGSSDSAVNKRVTPGTAHLTLTGYRPRVIVTHYNLFPKALKYIIEVHKPNGDLIAFLENYHEAQLIFRKNEPAILSFSLPADDVKKQSIVMPNELWVRNYYTGAVIRKLRITTGKHSR